MRPFTRRERVVMVLGAIIGSGVVLGLMYPPASIVWTFAALPGLLIAWRD